MKSGAPPPGLKPVLLAIVIATLLASAVGLIVLFVVASQDEPRPATASQAPPPAPRRPSVSVVPPLCPLGDVDGDGAGDYALMVGRNSRRVALVNGADGRLQFADDARAYNQHTQPFCPGRGWFGVVDEGSMSMSLFRGGELAQPQVHQAFPSVPRDMSRGDGCFWIRQDPRGSPHPFSLSEAPAEDCVGGPWRTLAMGGLWEPTVNLGGHALEVCSEGGLCVAVNDARAENFLEVRVSDGGVERWAVPLRYVRPGRYLAAVLTSAAVVVIGKRRTAEGGGHFAIGLDPATGRERYVSPIRNERVHLMEHAGRHVVISQRFVVTAIDPVTGERAWQLRR